MSIPISQFIPPPFSCPGVRTGFTSYIKSNGTIFPTLESVLKIVFIKEAVRITSVLYT